MRNAIWAAALGLILGARADAAYTITFSQVGNDVVAAGSGSLTVVGGPASIVAGKGVQPAFGVAIIGAFSSYPGNYQVNFLRTAGFGTSNGLAPPDAGTGDPVGFDATDGLLYVPVGYVSGAALRSSTTFRGQTFASIGLTLGTYTYAYTFPGSSVVADSVVIQVGPAAVPEPSSLALCGIAGLAGLGIARGRRRLAARSAGS